MSKILEVKNVSYKAEDLTFLSGKEKSKEILKDINFSLDKGKILGIAGESGSGKTTLAKLIAGIKKPTSGIIQLNTSVEWKLLNPNPVQILFQNNGEILNPFRKVNSIVSEALIIRNQNVNVDQESERIFRSVNLNDKLQNRRGFELSGGEQQRVALARILAANPELIILDEPFSAQDTESQLNLLDLFLKIKEEFFVTIICISHDMKILRKLCDEILIMYNGKIVEQGNKEIIFNSPEHDYTKFLLRAENYSLTLDELNTLNSRLPE